MENPSPAAAAAPAPPPPSLSPSPKLERQSSVDTEPKTLFDIDIKLAREAALKVLADHTEEEALEIFLKGLKPIKAEAPKVEKEPKGLDLEWWNIGFDLADYDDNEDEVLYDDEDD